MKRTLPRLTALLVAGVLLQAPLHVQEAKPAAKAAGKPTVEPRRDLQLELLELVLLDVGGDVVVRPEPAARLADALADPVADGGS